MVSSLIKKASVRIAILVMTFLVGVSAHAFMLRRQTTILVLKIRTATAQREEDMHRLYEAAMLSGDSDLRAAAMQRLFCMNTPEPSDVRLVEAGGNCLANAQDFPRFLKSHKQWTKQNMDFVTEVSNAKKARAYAIKHLY